MAKPELEKFAHYIEGELGIVYGEANLYQLEHRLERIMQFVGVATLENLWKRVSEENDRALKSQILDASTNNETSFFRDEHIFQAFEEVAVPEVLKNKSDRELHVWSAACSTGQEPYSLAMLLHENSTKHGITKWEIQASDFSDRALAKAKSGKYNQIEVQRGLPVAKLIKYFEKLPNDEWELKPLFQSHIHFKRHNLLDTSGTPEEFDIIFLRNMLIYQSIENKRKIVEQVTQRLKSKGAFFMGGAESLMGVSDAYDQVSSHGAYYYRKKK